MGRRRKSKKTRLTRGFGTRYGVTTRKRYATVLSEMKKKHKCPRCGSESLLRRSVGVWSCRKCDFTFTGGAYTPATKLGILAKRAVRGASHPEATIEKET